MVYRPPSKAEALAAKHGSKPCEQIHSHLALATQTLTQVSLWSNNISAAHITCRTHIVFSGPSYYCHQDLAFDATVNLRLFLNLHSEVVASVPDPTGDMRPSSCWAFGSFPAPIVMRPSGTHRPCRTGYGACQACSPTLLASLRQIYSWAGSSTTQPHVDNRVPLKSEAGPSFLLGAC